MDPTQLASQRLIAWARQRAGVFTREDAVGFGMTEHQFYRGLQEATWLPYRGVYILAGSRHGQRTRLWAALSQSHPSAAVTGPTALHLHGLDASLHPADADLVYISVPSRSHRPLTDVLPLREARPPTSFVDIDGMRTVTRQRAIVDTVRLLGWNSSKTAVYRALQLDWITPIDLFDATEELARCRGNRELKKAAAAAATGSHAESERIAQQILRKHGITGFVTNFEVRSDWGLVAIIDIAFVDYMVAIEIDGRAWHSDPERFQRDRSRQNSLVNGGWTVLRFTWDDLISRPNYVAKTVQSTLEQRRLVRSPGGPGDLTNLG